MNLRNPPPAPRRAIMATHQPDADGGGAGDCASAPSAQDQDQQSQQPTFRGGINVVRVDLATRDGRVVDDRRQPTSRSSRTASATIDAFELVRVRPPVAQELRAEPNSVAESRQMAADSRARIFVIFLDTYHTQIEGSARMRSPLLQFIDRVVGQDDLVGSMTPEMSASDADVSGGPPSSRGCSTTTRSGAPRTHWRRQRPRGGQLRGLLLRRGPPDRRRNEGAPAREAVARRAGRSRRAPRRAA